MLSSMEQHPVLTIVSVEISEDYNIRQDTRKQETWTIAKQLRLGGEHGSHPGELFLIPLHNLEFRNLLDKENLVHREQNLAQVSLIIFSYLNSKENEIPSMVRKKPCLTSVTNSYRFLSSG